MKVDSTEIRKALQSPKSKKYGLRFLIAVVLIGVVGFFALPPVVKYFAVKKLSELLHRPVAIQNISINPYVMSLTVDGLDIKEREGEATFVGFDSLYVNAMLLLLAFGIKTGSTLYFEAALMIALLGFVSTVALAKFLLRGEIIE